MSMPVSPCGRNPPLAYDGVVTSEAIARSVDQQGSSRPDAERDIDLVLAFLNTVDAEIGTDVLDDVGQWRRWCAEQELREAPNSDPAREFRDAMRESVTCGRTPDTTVPPAWPTQVVLRGGVPTLTGTDALGTVLTSAVHLVHTGHWDRIKICPAQDCLMAFYDRSRNRSRTWCSMSVCGNRKKARSWRERHTAS